jgi:ABC-type phosphate/phosphonate transport system substrate-binding protein
MEILRRTKEEEPVNPRRINGAIEDDLATICLKCLEKDPAQRYVSAQALADDLNRWLRRESIHARRTSIVRRTSRWVRRNRAGTTVIASLVAGLMFTLVALMHAKRVQASKDLALANFARAIGRQIDALGSTNSFYEITAEQFGYLQGKEPTKFSTRPKRFTIGVFIYSNPLETVLGYGQLFAALEPLLSVPLKQPVRLDFRVYTEMEQAAQHLLAGRIHFLRVDAVSALRLCESGEAKLLVQEAARSDMAVIFTRSDSGLTNIAQLEGRSIAFIETNSVVTFVAKQQLLANGLQARDVQCVYLNGPSDTELAKPSYFEAPEQGYFDRQCETVRQVLDYGAHTAGVARKQQFRMKRAGEWHVLAEFRFPRHVWLGSPKLSDADAQSFRCSLITGTHMDKDSAKKQDGFGAGYEVQVTAPSAQLLSNIRQIVTAAAEFDGCVTNLTSNPTEKRAFYEGQ